MELLDFIIGPIYVGIILFIGLRISSRFIDPIDRRMFNLGLLVKLISSFAIGVIYWFYYQDGDTVYYYERMLRVANVLKSNTSLGLKLVFSAYPEEADETYFLMTSLRAFDTASYMVVRIAAIVNTVCFGIYTNVALLFSVFAFSGLWQLYRITCDALPKVSKRYLGYAILLFPSVVFWGSGLLKDTLTLGGITWVIACFYRGIIKGKKPIVNILTIIVIGYFVSVIKSYILVAFVPAAFLWYVAEKRLASSSAASTSLNPVLATGAILISLALLSQLGDILGRYSVENLQHEAEAMQQWHHQVEEVYDYEGSSYSLGNTDFSTVGLITKAPIALITTFLRPFPWEVGNPLMVLSSLESLALLSIGFLALFQSSKNSEHSLVRIFKQHPILQFSLVFSLIFGFAVGFTAYNFGALVRYKIPCLPTVGIILAALYSLRSNQEAEV
ncbi:MAG: hypothetical protein DBW80_00435 [Bacteroidetes bacterium]|nr:MAG: hypothetical protein DBW80_00435 [Bacteroidota bacterium]